ncbi:PREDICTED: uncharacterized protein LOC109239071 [Nicotiana attenuata]|uniref:uncharacterized protein LOC109239071 n=1 Tax=Nicotiana attenuata TaxID=49451 RepID=UPI0009047204|nr:PREDICTED: uncharacterized protein LOC109239071 [Nicotiana attenuata]
MLKKLYVSIPFTEVLIQMPAYAKFLKEILSSMRKLEKMIVVKLNSHCSAILQNKIPQKCENPGNLTIPCSLGSEKFDKALCDSRASISLMPLSVFRKLEGELGVIKSVPVSLQLANQTTILPEGIIEDILVRVDKFVFPVDFIVVDMEVNKEVPLILGRPFLCTGRAILDIYKGQLMLRVGNEKVVFQIKRIMKYPSDEVSAYLCFKLDIVRELAEKYKLDKLVGHTLEKCITQSSTVEDEDPEIKKEAKALETENQVVNEEELKEEASKPNVELKVLPTHLKYAFLETNNFPMIVSSDLTGTHEQKLVELLKKHKKAIDWDIADIQGINPAICMHKILLEENSKPVVQSNSSASCTEEGSITMVKHEDNELIPTRTVTGWRMCIDYRRLNDAIRKDHFPLPFINQMLEKVAGHGWYFFLDLYSGYNRIPIAQKMLRKPHSLAHQRCMMSIFSNLNGKCLEVFMDDFTLFGYDFEDCLMNLKLVLERCEAIHWLPLPTSVKSIRSFLGHAGFYKRFINNFFSITKPLTTLLAKDAKFIFNVECLRAFELIKEKVFSAPIMVTPDWSQPFEMMCDASDVGVGAILGQRKDKIFGPIYYASRTLNDAQVNYATTEKEFFDVVFSFDKFRSYLVGSKVIVHTDHSALKYKLSKKESKLRLMRWVLLIQEFHLEIKDRKGTKNQVEDHLSRLEKPPVEIVGIREEFADEQIFSTVAVSEWPPWYVDIANFLASGWLPHDLTHDQRRKLQSEVKSYFWDDPFLFKLCADSVIRRCVPEGEMASILSHCHDGVARGHYGGNRTAAKVMEADFFWTTLYRDAGRDHRLGQMNEFEEFRLDTYESVWIFKEKTKRWHDRLIKPKEFHEGDRVLLCNSRLRLFPRKFKSRSTGPYVVKHVSPYGAIEIQNQDGTESFNVNGHILKPYLIGGSAQQSSSIKIN